jgi:ABC-type Fe3+-hydroxamate transport system substrate-binding protein
MRIKTILSCLLTACLLLAACHGRGNHETEEQALAKYRPRADALTEKLHTVAANLPKEVKPQSPSAVIKPDPPMSLRFGMPDQNTAIIAEPQLLDIQSTPPFEAWSGDDLVLFLRWMDATKDKPSSQLQGDPNSISQDAERILATRYLVVLRVTDYTPPTAKDPNHMEAGYKGGSASVDVFVVSLNSAQVLDAFSIPVAVRKDVAVEYSKNDSTYEVEQKMEAAARKSMEHDAADALMRALKDRLYCKTL